MSRYSIIFWDLDGAITNPFDSITGSVRHAPHKLGKEELEKDDLLKFIGPPLRDSFQKIAGPGWYLCGTGASRYMLHAYMAQLL